MSDHTVQEIKLCFIVSSSEVAECHKRLAQLDFPSRIVVRKQALEQHRLEVAIPAEHFKLIHAVEAKNVINTPITED